MNFGNVTECTITQAGAGSVPVRVKYANGTAANRRAQSKANGAGMATKLNFAPAELVINSEWKK